jgi:hypothetical protein
VVVQLKDALNVIPDYPGISSDPPQTVDMT